MKKAYPYPFKSFVAAHVTFLKIFGHYFSSFNLEYLDNENRK